MVNIIIKKIGILNLGKIIGGLFRSKSLELVITISLSFIPILSKELINIKNSLKTKNFNLNIKNVLLKPHIFVVTYFTNLFRRVNEMEKFFAYSLLNTSTYEQYLQNYNKVVTIGFLRRGVKVS